MNPTPRNQRLVPTTIGGVPTSPMPDPFPSGFDPTPTLETMHNDLADQLGKLGVAIDELEKRLAIVLWSHPEPTTPPEPSESYPCVALDFIADRIHQTKGYANRLRRIAERLAL
jgi:hypothetical protein